MKVMCFLKKYAGIIIGFVIIALFVGVLGICRLEQNKEWNSNQEFTEEMLREQTDELLEDPLLTAEYFINAVIEKDLDKALRGCAIDERCLNNNYKEIMEQKEQNEVDVDIAPSVEDIYYYPVNSSIFTDEYVNQISVLMDSIGQKEMKVRNVNYAKTSKMTLQKYEEDKDMRDAWGMESVEEMLIELEDATGKDYMVALRIAKYDDGWKIFEIGSKELDLTYQNPIKEVDEKVYLEFIDKEKNKKKKDSKKIEEIVLPLNYSMISQKEEKSINKVVEEFTACMQRKDLQGAMNYIKLDKESSFFEQQRVVAEQMRDLCKELMEIRDTNRNPMRWDTEDLTYLSLSGIYEINKNVPEDKIIVYYYEGNFFAVGCRFTEENRKWMIEQFIPIKGKNEEGYAVKITKDELKQIRDFQNSEEVEFKLDK